MLSFVRSLLAARVDCIGMWLWLDIGCSAQSCIGIPQDVMQEFHICVQVYWWYVAHTDAVTISCCNMFMHWLPVHMPAWNGIIVWFSDILCICGI